MGMIDEFMHLPRASSRPSILGIDFRHIFISHCLVSKILGRNDATLLWRLQMRQWHTELFANHRKVAVRGAHDIAHTYATYPVTRIDLSLLALLGR